ncbi:DUF4450 domain-containing protein [Mucilaginibacter mali]|uniref:DUF4450 domain-containing protein n=1 Tax=Mucilaginibacter mali TaxID=2740462 RepID=A0A7D4TWR9_9SPHI|nr:DUF4450 domain-containing protein [Mucilaginibacter mali]QKJ29777.1 DUF4450 domain-containing protein [Mucilaginibacter mali]
MLKYKKQSILYQSGKQLMFAFLFTSVFLPTGTHAQTQPSLKLWHGIERELRYHPDGQDFVINNGKRRFNRALYGTNTAFRVEAGDLPEFALYLPGMGGNLKFGLVSGTESKWLINTASIEARYRPGTMIYTIKDPMLGNGTLNIQVLAGSADENIIVKANFSNTNKNVNLLWAFGGATGKKFSRDGDIGADPESSFYLKPEYCNGNVYTIDQQKFTLNFSGKAMSEAGRYEIDQTGKGENKVETVVKSMLFGQFPVSEQVHVADANALSTPLSLLNSKGSTQPVLTGVLDATPGKDQYWVIQSGKSLGANTPTQLFNSAEAARQKLASRVQVKTPDPFINTYGGALSVAADGIWEDPSYMHGAVAWRMRLPAWRGPYVADPLGWHDRAWSHFSSYALSQMTEPESGPVTPDTALHLARQLEKLGTAMFSSGYISRNPGGKIVPHHYDMNLVYIDELLNHFKWTGNLDEVKKLWPTIKRSLAWEKRNYDADGDGLYDAYCAIWASDAMQYSGGGVTHSSAYNYRANRDAAFLAKLVGDDPKPYEQEATHILSAMNKQLWLSKQGNYAEYKDLLGEQLLHPSAGLWTIYHAIDSDVPDAFQTYQSLRYVDTHIPHIPVIAKGLSGDNYLLSTTNWEPYDWSLNNVVMAENLHTALAYWQGNRPEDAYKLWKSAILESMYLGASPGNFQQISFYDAVRGELYRDFGDPIGMGARSLVEGLFGIRPDLLNNTVTIKPGLPAEWNYASLSVPDVKFDFKRDGQSDTYLVESNFAKGTNFKFIIPRLTEKVNSVTLNGKPVQWAAEAAVGQPLMVINAGRQSKYALKITWNKATTFTTNTSAEDKNCYQFITVDTVFKMPVLAVTDPQHVLRDHRIQGKRLYYTADEHPGHHTFFAKIGSAGLNWWVSININISPSLYITAPLQQPENELRFKAFNYLSKSVNVKINHRPYTGRGMEVSTEHDLSSDVVIPVQDILPGTNAINVVPNGLKGGGIFDTTIINWHVSLPKNLRSETINLQPYFNDKVTNIFKNQYLSPRPKSPTLQLPTQGIGNWAYPLVTANIDDSGIKKESVDGMFTTPQGIKFAIDRGNDKNILFTSHWDNYPKQATVPLTGKALHAYFLMAGSTNPMQSRMVNATVTVTYTDGSKTVLELKNPENWWPIEQDCDNDGFAFDIDAPRPLRVHLKTGEVTDNNRKFTGIKGFSNKGVDGGAATVLDLPLDPSKQLKDLLLATHTNDVVIGLMAVTLIRP